jgi:AcrR family transcriptional regulator
MLSREVIDEFRRERLLDAVLEMTAKHGYGRVTVGHVVSAARTSRNSFYEHFEHKDDAVLRAMGVGYAAIEQRLDEACATAAGEDFGTRLHVALTAVLEWAAANRAAAHLCFVEAAAIGPIGLEAQLGFQDRITARLATAAPPDPDRPPATEQFVVGAVSSLVVERLRMEREGDLFDALPELTETLLSLYATAAAAGSGTAS